MGRKLALIVGNSQYEDQGLARLTAPDADVHALAEVLRDGSIGGFDAVEPIVNESFAHTRRAIARFFDGRKRDDLLLLYFSGHGIRDEYGHLHLAVRDTERTLLAATAIESSFITECMDRSASKRLVLVLDCCHSGAFGYGLKSATQGASVGTAVAFEGTGRGRVVLTATDATQDAWEGDTIIGTAHPSVFTRHVTEGLRTGAADMDGDGIVTIDELYEYVYDQVVNDTAKQTPGKWAFGQQGEIVIARNPTVAVVREDEAKKRPRPRARVDQDDERPWRRAAAVAIETLRSRIRQPATIVATLATAAVLVMGIARWGPTADRAAGEPAAPVVPAGQGVAQPAPTPTQATATPEAPVAKPQADADPDVAGVKPVASSDPGAAVSRPPSVLTQGNRRPADSTPPPAARPPLDTAVRGPAVPPVVSPEPSRPEPRDKPAASAPPPPRPVVVTISAELQIQNALRQYTQARNDMDLEALTAVFPNAPVSSFQIVYRQITSENVTLTKCTKPAAEGATASVECNELVRSKFTTGTSQTQASGATFSLRRESDRWVITQVRRRAS